MIQKGVSIIVCTYNGAALLPNTLRHLANQNVPDNIDWEVILIDNASSDYSAQVAETEWVMHNCTAPLHIFNQPLLGLNFARELGFAKARYSYIIMCDDDNWLASDYVANSYTIMEQNPAIGMLGGHGELVYEAIPPKWVIDFSIHAGGPQAPSAGKVDHFGVYGAGSVLRKAAYMSIRQAGFTFLLTDRLGKQLSSGGDFELCYGLAMANYLIWYDGSLRFKHFIPSNRITWPYYVNYLSADSLSFVVLEPYKIFLTTNSNSLLIFGYTVVKNLIFYTLTIFVNILKMNFLHPADEARKVKSLKIIAAKARINSYKHFREMGKNFLAAGRFRLKSTKNQSIHSNQESFYSESEI